MNYQELLALAARARDKAKGKPVASNTRVFNHDTHLSVMLYTTEVVRSHPDNTFTLRTGGWYTPTTKDRIETYSPARIHTRNGCWFLQGEVPLIDGLVIDGTGKPVQLVTNQAREEFARKERFLTREITKYISGFVETVGRRELKDPGPGDCCLCRVQSTTHILDHLQESYYVPSLLYWAYVEACNGDEAAAQRAWHLCVRYPNQHHVRCVLRRYFRRRKTVLIDALNLEAYYKER